MQKRNKILVTPQSSLLKRDKHIELLYSTLSKHGYNAEPFSIRKAIRFGRQAIWHIHWIDVFHTGKIRSAKMKNNYAIISMIRLMFFLIQVSICKFCNVKILWTIHNVTSHEQPYSFFESVVTKLLFIFCDKVTTLNNYIKNRMSEIYGFSDMALMRQGLYEGCYADTITRKEARQRLGLADDDFVLVFLGVVEEYKGIDVAIQAMDEIADESVKLLVAGRLDRNTAYGAQVSESASRNKNIILFDNFIPDDEVQVYFKAADYSIYPYRRTGNSGPLYITLAFRIPTIIREAGGSSEVVALNPNVAILIGPPEKSEIVQAIRMARSTKVEDMEFDVFWEKLSWKSLEKEIIQIFDEFTRK